MEVNKKILKIGVISIIIIFIIVLSFAFRIKLDNPVFLKSYIERGINLESGFYRQMDLEIKYISNTYDKREVGYIEIFNNNRSDLILLANRVHQEVESYGLYNVNRLHLQIDYSGIIEDVDKLEFNTARIIFNNGDTIEEDLGRFILHIEDEKREDVESTSSGSSSDGTYFILSRLKEDMEIVNIESPLFKEAKELYSIKINGKDYKDTIDSSYEKGDRIRINSSFKSPEDFFDKYSQFDLVPRLYFKDSKGEKSYISINNISYHPNDFSFQEIYKYLKLRGEI